MHWDKQIKLVLLVEYGRVSPWQHHCSPKSLEGIPTANMCEHAANRQTLHLSGIIQMSWYCPKFMYKRQFDVFDQYSDRGWTSRMKSSASSISAVQPVSAQCFNQCFVLKQSCLLFGKAAGFFYLTPEAFAITATSDYMTGRPGSLHEMCTWLTDNSLTELNTLVHAEIQTTVINLASDWFSLRFSHMIIHYEPLHAIEDQKDQYANTLQLLGQIPHCFALVKS